MTASDIINAFGGLTKLADALGAPTSTVYSWQKSNFIPIWRQPRIMELALERNVQLSTTDFPVKSEQVAA